MRDPRGFADRLRINRGGSRNASVDTYDYSMSTLSSSAVNLKLPEKELDASPAGSSRDQFRVILTGSTGNLGAYILDRLLRDPNCDSIICLNRSENARERQRLNARRKGLGRILSSRVRFLKADFGSSRTLGLSKDDYASLIEPTTFTVVIHNAWPVDFNKPFEAFEPSISGVRNIIDLVLAHGRARASLLFISSISVAANWGALPGAHVKVPEAEIEDWKTARMGYGQSKLVAERLIAEASRTSGIIAVVCRVGQVAGPVIQGVKESLYHSSSSLSLGSVPGVGRYRASEDSHHRSHSTSSRESRSSSAVRPKRGGGGMWPKQEWLPSLIASSKYLKVLPDALGAMNDIAWVPVDVVAGVVQDLSILTLTQKVGTVHFDHVVNPHPALWSNLTQTIRNLLGHDVQLVSFPKWAAALLASEAAQLQQESTDMNLDKNPALKLTGFFENVADKAVRLPKLRQAVFETKLTARRSKTLAELEPVNCEWMELWLLQWDY